MTFSEVVAASDQSAARRLARENTGRLVVIDRGGPRSVVFQCPCGCGDMLVINVDPALKRCWRFRRDEQGISLMPSIWRTTGCHSHFILWENRVWWCGSRDWDSDVLIEDEAWPEQMKNELRHSWAEFRRLRKPR